MAVQFAQPHRFSADQYRRMAEIGVVPHDRTELIDGVVVFGTRPFRFSSDDYFRLGKEGILGEDDRVELLDGEIIDMSPIGGRHSRCVMRLITLLGPLLGSKAQLRVQDVLRLPNDGDPEPDVVVCRPLKFTDENDDSQATAADALLVVEVADSSILYDRIVKAGLYAAAGIPEYWVVDLPRKLVLVAQNPVGGEYVDAREYGRGERWRSPALNGAEIRVDEVLGPQQGTT